MTDWVETPVAIPCGDITLEGLLSLPADPLPFAAVCCHPHPLYGGDMRNAVVRGACIELAQVRIPALRFNFRGVGGSGGVHEEGEGERRDVAAAIAYLLKRLGPSCRWVDVAGYSFGAWVGWRAAGGDPRVRALAAIAPPVAFLDMKDAGRTEKLKFCVAGTRDEFAPQAELAAWFASLPEPKMLKMLEGADHFLLGRERAIGRLLAEFLLSQPLAWC